MTNILLIGCGYHARRIYVPHIIEQKNVKLSAIVDLTSQKEIVDKFLKEKSVIDVSFYYTHNKISDDLDKKEIYNLNKLVIDNKINTVIISTEPLAHFKYAKWALKNGLHILMDKPITTEHDVSTNKAKAIKLYSDYIFLKKLYKNCLKKKNIVFILQAQRRHHLGFLKTKELILEISRKTNCPVTSIQAFHSDGQWRFPKEIIEQNYHPYNQGYGKMSHSGYHSLDTAIWFAQSSILDSKKKYTIFNVYAQAVRPIDFLFQLTPKDYQKIFPNIEKEKLFSDKELETILKSTRYKSITGELDTHALITLKNKNKIITNISIGAVHNGFSQRNWTSTEGKDLYKGNGRIRHESYIIEQGPFQCIIVNSFQSQEILKSNKNFSSVGGEYHYDIHIFRNSTLFPEYKSYELITMHDINRLIDLKHSRGHQEDARRNCFEEFISSIEKNIPRNYQNSNFLEHEVSTKILSAIYQSMSVDVKNKVITGKI